MASGAEIDVTDINKRAAVHYAFYLGHEDFAAFLIRSGASLDQRDADGRTPLDYARSIRPGKDVKLMAELASVYGAEDPPATKRRPSPMRADADYMRLDYLVRQLRSEAVFGKSKFLTALCFIAVVASLSDSVGWNLWGLSIWAPILLCLVAALYLIVPFWRESHKIDRNEELDQPARTSSTAAFMDIAASRNSARAVSEILKHTSRLAFQNLSTNTTVSGLAQLAYPFALAFQLLAPYLCGLGVFALGYLYLSLFDFINHLQTTAGTNVWNYSKILGVVLGAPAVIIIIVLVALAVTSLLVGPGWIAIFLSFKSSAWALAARIKSRQRQMAGRVEKLLEDESYENEQGGNVLYLRSFAIDGSFRIGAYDLEALIVFALNRVTSVVALGYNPDRLGPAGLSATSANWRDKVDRLAQSAGLILMIPWDSEGVIWEIQYLRKRGYFEKAVFIAPPNDDDNRMAQRWDTMRGHPSLRELEIPPYCETGFLFTLHYHGELNTYGPLGLEVAPPPLELPIEFVRAFDNDDGDQDDSDGGTDPGYGNGDSGQSSPTSNPTLSHTTLQLAMQSVPVLTAAEFVGTISQGGSDDGGDGNGGGLGDGGGVGG